MAGETPNEQYKRLVRDATNAKTGRTKYKNEPIVREGIRYDSKAEYEYRGVLDMQVKAGAITGYDFHVMLPLIAFNGEIVGHYEIDYLCHLPDGSQEIRDVKGAVTSLFAWKARHVKAQYGYEIILINPKTLKPKTK